MKFVFFYFLGLKKQFFSMKIQQFLYYYLKPFNQKGPVFRQRQIQKIQQKGSSEMVNRNMRRQDLKRIFMLLLLACCSIHCKDEKNSTIAYQNAVLLTSQPSNLTPKSLIPLFSQINQPPYKRIYTSSQYHLQFVSQLSKLPQSQTINATYIGNGKQLCLNNVKCEFYYYVINPKEENNNIGASGDGNVRNVLFVAGMHGNEYLGPMSVLYAVKHMRTASTRVIIFPLANPSGFDRHQRTTFPTNLDPNRDFPIEQYSQCYQTSSSLIIDHIYRKYPIHLTLALHNGGSEIGWNWGTVSERLNSKTVDEVIYRDIGEWLRYVGGKNEGINMRQFRIGTMNEAVYPVTGGFEDWAYAASWYNSSVGVKPSIKCPFSEYPNNMTAGLVFLFQLGPFEVNEREFGSEEGLYINPASRDPSNGYISRAIRMFIGLIKILTPSLDIKFTNQNIVLSLQGCKNGILKNLIISNKSNHTQIYYSSKQKYQMFGSLNNKTIQPTVFQLEKRFFNDGEVGQGSFEKLQDKDLIVGYELVCDQQWEGRGRSIFGQKRLFHINKSLLLTTKPTSTTDQTLFPTLSSALSSTFHYKKPQTQYTQPFYTGFIETNSDTLMTIIIVIIVGAAILCIIWLTCKNIRREMKAQRIERLKRKLQKLNHQASIQQIGPYQSSEITLSNTPTNTNTPIPTLQLYKRKLESYPQMCESDKSMKTEQLKQ